MGLDDALAKARATLASGLLTNEAGVQASVIRPILRELGWDDADPQQWQVEYQVDNGRVDEALLGSLGKPLVFVEAKKQGNLSVKAEDQLFRYAANKGVPILVLTDGDTWDLYLSMAAGEPSERRFAHLTLTESSDLVRVAEDLRGFIEREAVLSGAGDDAAKARLKQVKDREIGRSGLESAWTELLREPDEMLRDLLIERVEQDVGSRPQTRDAEEFLRRQVQHSSADNRPPAPTETADVRTPAKRTSRQTGASKLSGIVIRGSAHRVSTAREALHLLAADLQGRDGDFLNRLAEFTRSGMKKPRAARTPLSSVRSEHRKYYQQNPANPDWYLMVHASSRDLQRYMREMTELAGLNWGTDVRLLQGDDSA